ncbi:MAG: nuclear transport factor 2 family protein [Pseudomonadota bacterium]
MNQGDREKRNMERVKHWEWAWNNDVMRMVDECYAEDCEVSDMLRGRTFRGRAELRLIEEQMMQLDSSRRMTITNMVPAGNTVAVEMDASWGDGAAVVKSSVFLTFDDEGLIVVDHSYGGDPNGAAENDPRER